MSNDVPNDHHPATSPTTFKILAVLGALASAWALFLWRELIKARNGAEPFCLGSGEGCSQLWDGPFASQVHDATGLPVAGWGVVWGLVALILPALVLARPTAGTWLRARRGAILWTAIAGLGGVVMLLGASLRAGAFCSNCAVTYVVTGLFALIALRGVPALPSWHTRGAITAVLTTAVAFAALLIPGLETPKSSASAARDAVTEAAKTLKPDSSPSAPEVNAGPIDAGAAITQMLSSLSPELQQGLANVLAQYRDAPTLATDPPRSLMGPADVPVRITDFTDIKCSHCATLHDTLDYIRGTLGDRYGVDQRYYPLDASCNPHLGGTGNGNLDSVRCLGARAQICMEDLPPEQRKAFVGELYAQQRSLDIEEILTVASRYKGQMALDACLNDPATAQKVLEDVNYAHRHEPRGTPLVLVNGREASPFGPFLFAIILAEGNADHPAFGSLPAPAPEDHSGHNH